MTPTPSRNPSIPAPYVAGNISVPANTVSNLLSLIQATIAVNCPGTSSELQLIADSSNTAPVFVGAANAAGPLSATNYAYQLTATGPPRVYRSAYPGTNTPIGELQVFSTAVSVLHVEVQS